jgi:hypothetical protein
MHLGSAEAGFGRIEHGKKVAFLRTRSIPQFDSGSLIKIMICLAVTTQGQQFPFRGLNG